MSSPENGTSYFTVSRPALTCELQSCIPEICSLNGKAVLDPFPEMEKNSALKENKAFLSNGSSEIIIAIFTFLYVLVQNDVLFL